MDLPNWRFRYTKKTIINLIETQDEDLRIHPAHGNSSTIGVEKRSNYFYLQWKK